MRVTAKLLPAALAAASLAGAVPAPRYLGGRALGMGGAFTALSDDYSALYYNPAGLARLNSALDAGVAVKVDMGDILGLAGDALNLAGQHAQSLGNVDSMSNDNTLVDDLMLFDRRPLAFGSLPEMHFAARSTDPDLPLGVGAGWYLGSQARFQLDKGIYLPSARADVRSDLVFKAGGAIAPLPGLAVGVSPTVATYRKLGESLSLEEYRHAQDTLEAQLSDERQRMFRPGLGLGFDLGVLYDIVPTEVRVGASANNLFLRIDGDRVPAAWNFGIAYLPAVLRRQGLLRRVNFDLDLDDAFGPGPFLSKVDLGAEMDLTVAQLRGGLKGGYPCFGLGVNLFIAQLEFLSWADEAGLYAGQLEDRHYMLGLRLGI